MKLNYLSKLNLFRKFNYNYVNYNKSIKNLVYKLKRFRNNVNSNYKRSK